MNPFDILFSPKRSQWLKKTPDIMDLKSRQGLLTFSSCVFIVLNESCKSKVSNLTDEFMRY